jgi:hypothetical protein
MVDARCPNHPDQSAEGTCTRCGVFVCAQDFKLIDAKVFCEACGALPEVNYIETFRLKYWGKRDGWAWLIGFGSLWNLIAALGALANGALVMGLVFLVPGAVGVCYFAGYRWTRVALFVTPLFSLIPALATGGTPEELGRALGASLSPAVLGLGIAALIFVDARNQLFFKVDLAPSKLRILWDVYCNNSIARQGFLLGLLSLVLWPVGPFAVVLSVIGLRRVNPNATPPMGRRGQAIAGIVTGFLSTLVLITLLSRT